MFKTRGGGPLLPDWLRVLLLFEQARKLQDAQAKSWQAHRLTNWQSD